MQASSLTLVKHFDYFMWISFNQVLGVLKLTDADEGTGKGEKVQAKNNLQLQNTGENEHCSFRLASRTILGSDKIL